MNPFISGSSVVRRQPWSPEIFAALILDKNPGRILTNSNLELAALVLHEASLLHVCPDANIAVPRSGPDNIPTVSWSTQEAYTFNPFVTYLLRIRALHSRKTFSQPFSFYHPCQENCTTDDASRLFDISDTPFLAYMSVTYPQPQILRQLCPPPQQLISFVVSTLCRKLFERGLLKMRSSRGCTGSGPNSAPPCRSSLLSNIHPSLESRSYRYMDTGSDMPATPSDAWTNLGKIHFLRRAGKLWQPASWMASPTPYSLQTPKLKTDWVGASSVGLKPFRSR